MDEREWWWMLEEMEAGADASSEKGKGCAVDEGNTSEGSTSYTCTISTLRDLTNLRKKSS